MKEMLKEAGIVTLVCFIFTLFIILFTPYPASELVYQQFKAGSPAQAPSDYQQLKKEVSVQKDLTYESLLPSNKYDLLRPKGSKKVPVIIWIHGGGYVGGQKSDTEIYATMLASRGFAVANMDYSLAPTNRYPSPLIQVSDLYHELAKNAKAYNLDMSQIIVAGDSAGGQIAAQYTTIQLDKSYSKQVNLPQDIPAKNLVGTVLLCTPFSLEALTQESSSIILDYFVKKIGWAYTGTSNWEDSEMVKEADLLTVVKKPFPKTFIADGNTFSFADQGKAFAKVLKDSGSDVTTVFYDETDTELMHEYQFDLSLKESQETFKKLTQFLEEVKK